MSNIRSSYSFCDGATSYAEDKYTCFLVTSDIVIHSISIAMRCTEDNASFTLSIVSNGNYIQRQTVNVPKSEIPEDPNDKRVTFVSVPFNAAVKAGNILRIDRDNFNPNITSRLAYYWAALNTRVDWGHTCGRTNSITYTAAQAETDCSEMSIDLTRTVPWTIDASNDGYPRLSAFGFFGFNGFSKDAETGIPYNWNAWRITDYNLGYPWKVPFDIAEPQPASNLYEKLNNQLIPRTLYIKRNNQLIPVNLQIKEDL